MAVTIQDGIVNAPNGLGQRAIAATADGTLWACVFNDQAIDRWEFWYSTDDGGTWTERVELRINSTEALPGGGRFGFTINTVDDRAVFVGTQKNLQSIDGLTTSSSAWVDGGAATWIDTEGFSDVATFQKPSSSNFYTAVAYRDGTVDRIRVFEHTSAGAWQSTWGTYSPAGADGTTAFDFHHDGGGHAVADSTPHLYVAYRSITTSRPNFRKFTFAAGNWSMGSEVELSTTTVDDTECSLVFDGTRSIVAFASANDVQVFERTDLATTDRSSAVPAMPGSAVSAVRVAANGTTGFDLFVLDETDDDIDYVTFTRSGASWGSFTEFANYASGLTAACWSVSKHKVGEFVPSVWLVDDGTNYDLDTDNRTFYVPVTPSPILCTTGVVEGRP